MYALICGRKVVAVCSTPRMLRHTLRHFSPNIGIKIRWNYRIKRAHDTGGSIAGQSRGVSYEARRKPVKYDRPLLPGEFKL